jgi:low-density lipoprotein receptor-related protein 1 (alpha-2-macroglobulin receptor)
VDWRGRNLYWCDKTTDTIEVSRLNGQLRKVLVRTGLDEPRAIAVHPYKGLLFYTDWGDEAHIGRLGMEGSNRIRLKIDRIGWPNALCVDYITDHIYWGDARLNYIATADLDGANMHIVLRHDLPHIFALSMFEDYLYFTDWERKSVEKVLLSQSLAPSLSKNETTYRKELVKVTNRPMDIQVLHPLRQKMSQKKDQVGVGVCFSLGRDCVTVKYCLVTMSRLICATLQVNPCENNGGCGSGSLCLIKFGGNDRMCACPEKHYLSQDKLTCYPNCSR